MSTSTNRNLIIQATLFLMVGLISCQSKISEQKTDAITKLVIHCLNTNKPDSVYQLTDEKYRKHMTLVRWASTYKEQISGLLPLTNLTFITGNDSVSVYKIDGKIPLNCYISLDKQNKISKFYFTPYQEAIKPVSMDVNERETDMLAQKVLNFINHKQADSAYMLAGDYYKSKVSLAKWRDYAGLIFSVIPLPPAVFLKSYNGVNQYAMRSYQFGFGAIDKAGKFNTFGFNLYTETAVKTEKALTDNKLISPLDSTVDKVISTYIQTKGNVGVSVGVLYQGHNYFYNYGERKKGSNELPDQHTLYDIGSITKTFTSTLLAIAVDQKKVTLETPITKFLPDSVAVNPDLKKITFKDLANHTSGLPRWGENYERTITDADQPFDNYGDKEMFSFLKHYKLTRQPGTVYEYSNLAVGLLGVLLEKIYNQPYPELLRQYITAPLQMNETICTVDSLKFKDVAEGYGEVFESIPFLNLTALQAAGIIKSSAADLITYTKAQLATSNLTLSAAIKLTHQITYNNGSYLVGLNWHYLPTDQSVLLHTGGTIGYRSFICVDLSKLTSIVILTNNVSAGDAMGVNLIKAVDAIKTK
ncbi:serine hydrolase domain-containing protein [Mucilaginibacter sp.]